MDLTRASATMLGAGSDETGAHKSLPGLGRFSISDEVSEPYSQAHFQDYRTTRKGLGRP